MERMRVLPRKIRREQPQSREVSSEIAAILRRQRVRLRSRMSGYKEIGQDRLSGSAFIAVGAEKLSREERGFFRKRTVLRSILRKALQHASSDRKNERTSANTTDEKSNVDGDEISGLALAHAATLCKR